MIFSTAFYLNVYISFAVLISLTLCLYAFLAFRAYLQSCSLSNTYLEELSDVRSD